MVSLPQNHATVIVVHLTEKNLILSLTVMVYAYPFIYDEICQVEMTFAQKKTTKTLISMSCKKK